MVFILFLLKKVGMYDDEPHENYVKKKEEKLQELLNPFECKYFCIRLLFSKYDFSVIA